MITVPVVIAMRNAPFPFLRSSVFWAWGLATFVITSAFFAWELKLIVLPILNLPRAPATPFELSYTAILIMLLTLAAGLFGWQRRFGSCPVGVKRTVGIAGTLGGLALLCPVCLALPAAFLGIGTLFAIIGVYLPLIRVLAMVFALLSVWLLWPHPTAPNPSTTPRVQNGRS